MPERAPPGQLPRSITVVLDGPLVDAVKPGDRVEVTGVYKTVAGEKSSMNGVFQTVLIGLGIEEINMETGKLNMTTEDIKNIRKMAKDPEAFKMLSDGVAPSIQGHTLIKKSVLL